MLFHHLVEWVSRNQILHCNSFLVCCTWRRRWSCHMNTWFRQRTNVEKIERCSLRIKHKVQQVKMNYRSKQPTWSQTTKIFFSPSERLKWLKYLCSSGVSFTFHLILSDQQITNHCCVLPIHESKPLASPLGGDFRDKVVPLNTAWHHNSLIQLH